LIPKNSDDHVCKCRAESPPAHGGVVPATRLFCGSAAFCAVEAELHPDSSVPSIVKQILSYFERNPEAVDSLEGIARWRLLEEQIQRSLRESELAVQWLVEKGFLIEESRISSGRLYRLNPAKKPEIAAFLETGESSEQGEC
jgi:hypothetical protein